MQKILFLALAAITIFASCKKDKKDISLVGKWTVESYTINYYDDDILDETETAPGNGATFDFQSNGQVVVFSDGTSETQPYTIVSDSTVDIGGDLLEIKNLTASSVTLYFRDNYLPGEYTEIIFNLRR